MYAAREAHEDVVDWYRVWWSIALTDALPTPASLLHRVVLRPVHHLCVRIKISSLPTVFS